MAAPYSTQPGRRNIYDMKWDRPKSYPLIGPWIGRVGRVIDITSNPCTPTPEIWINAAFDGIPVALWSFLKPSPTDFLAERFGKTNRAKKKFKFSLFARQDAISPGKGRAGAVRFAALGMLRRIGWYITFADASTGFLLNWTSTAYRWNGCTVPGGSFAQCHLLEDSVQLLPAGDILLSYWIGDGSQGMATGPTGIAVPSGTKASVGYSLASEPNSFGLPDATWTARLVRLPGFVQVAGAVTVDEGGGVAHTQGFFANGLAWNRKANRELSNGTYSVIVSKSYGVIQWSGGTMSATGAPNTDAITPDP